MKKKLISLLQRKRHIVALSTILMTFIVMSCLFIDSVDITQMIDGKAVNYAKAGTTATFKMHGHIKVQGDPRNDKRLVFGFLAPKSWNLAQNARVSYTEDTFDPNIGEQNMTLDNHGDFFEGSISCTFADTVDGHFHLTRAVQNTGYRIGSSHTQVVVTVSRKYGIIDAVYMVDQVFYFSTIF